MHVQLWILCPRWPRVDSLNTPQNVSPRSVRTHAYTRTRIHTRAYHCWSLQPNDTYPTGTMVVTLVGILQFLSLWLFPLSPLPHHTPCMDCPIRWVFPLQRYSHLHRVRLHMKLAANTQHYRTHPVRLPVI
jgi:hypothetical protein